MKNKNLISRVAHFAVRGGAYDIVISEDGKSIYIKKRPGFRIIIR